MLKVLDWVLARLEGRFERVVLALAEALYPPNRLGAPSGADAEVGPRTVAHVRRLPLSVRRQVMLMFIAVELFTPLLDPLGGFMSARSPARRLVTIRRWRASRLHVLRLLGLGIHAQLQMLYLSHPAVLAYIGEYKPVRYPDDALDVEIRPMGGVS